MDILIKNGRVWDGTQFLHADILTEKDRIVRLEPGIEADAKFVYDAQGQTVSAGLVDCHMHLAGISQDSYAIHPELGCIPFGVTAAADAGGSRGSGNLLRSFTVKNAVFADSVIRDDRLNPTATRRHLALYGSEAVGIKLFYDATSKNIRTITPLLEVCAFAREQGLKVMVHCNHSPTSMLSIVETLSPGDILSHIYHGGQNDCTENDFAALRLARQKSVVLDAAFAGHVHTDFAVLQKAVKVGFLPDTLSTDLTKNSAYKRGGRYGMTMAMSMARTAGMAEADIFRCVTTAPAEALGKSWGRLQVGSVADIAVLDYCAEPFSLTDTAGNVFADSHGYRCKLTVADGVVVFRD